MLAEHPGVASVSCADCKAFVYDLKTGKRERYECGSEGEKDLTRTGPPPCELGWVCPKGSPEHEHEHVLNWRNRRMVDAYLEHRAAGPPNGDTGDMARRQAFVIVARWYEEMNRQFDAAEIAARAPIFRAG